MEVDFHHKNKVTFYRSEGDSYRSEEDSRSSENRNESAVLSS